MKAFSTARLRPARSPSRCRKGPAAPRDRGGAMSTDVRTAAAHVRSAKLAQPFRAPLHPRVAGDAHRPRQK